MSAGERHPFLSLADALVAIVNKRVFVVDDHPLIRVGLRHLFEDETDFEVCGEAESVDEALAAVPRLRPDLVVTDLMMDGFGGLELTRRLAGQPDSPPVLILSMHDDRLYARRALAAGAKGYVVKLLPSDEVIRAARDVLSGRIHVSEYVRRQMETDDVGTLLTTDQLSDRELEVFLLIGQGYAPRHIAEHLELSVRTVEVYRERLKEKLGIESSPLLLRYAVSWCRNHS